MGVTGLWHLIDSSGKPVPLETLENKILAIDISIWLHQVVKGFQDSKGHTLANAHLLGLFHRLCKLLFYKIKPIFVFDGGAPAIKKQTMAKRFEAKNKYKTEADRIQQLLMESLAKEKIVQQALGASTKLLISPKKNPTATKEPEKEDMFKLPPIKETESIISVDSSTDILTDSESSFDEPTSRNYYQSLNTIDVTSANFKSLPPDVRLEILTDMKELRKQSSWGRLHELPAQSNDFSSFQMNRLLKRRQVQVSLEEAEKEVGGKCLSMSELETLLLEVGVEIDSNIGTTRKIISDENARFLLVRDLKKTMEQQEKDKASCSTKIQENIQDPIAGCSKDFNKILLQKNSLQPVAGCSKDCDDLEEMDEFSDEYDEDLQRAIKMSLQPTSNKGSECEIINDDNDDDDEKLDDCGIIKMSDEQKKLLSGAAGSLARGFMMEYAGFSNEEVVDLLEFQRNTESNADDSFRYNDSFILKGISSEQQSRNTTVEEPKIIIPDSSNNNLKSSIVISENSKIQNLPNSAASLNLPKQTTEENSKLITDTKKSNENLNLDSDTDSDFIDVPDDAIDDFNTSDMEIFPIHSMTVDLQDTKDLTRDFRLEHLELIIKPIKTKDELQDDIFADVFESIIPENNPKIELKEEKVISDILEELNKEKANVTKLDLNSIKINDSEIQQADSNQEETLKNEENISKNKNIIPILGKEKKEERKVIEIIEISDSSQSLSKSQETIDSDATIIDEIYLKKSELKTKEIESDQKSISIIEIKPIDEIIEINDDDSSLGDQNENRKPPTISIETNKKQTHINLYFQENHQKNSVLEKTPEKNVATNENQSKIVKPFFINRSPKSKKKDNDNSVTDSSVNSDKSVKKTLFEITKDKENLKNSMSDTIIEEAANILKENKTNDELKDLAKQLNKDNKELEVERNKQDRFGAKITDRMNKECMNLLKLFGIPYIVAPMEAEAQCAFLNHIDMTDGTITDDSDIWLFGGKTVYKNFFNQKKYVTEFTIENVEKLFNINRKKLIQLAMLVGSDYTTGINGVGAVTAMEILASFPATPEKDGETNEFMSMLSGLRKFRDWLSNGKTVGPGGKTALRSKLKNVTLSDGFPRSNIVEAYLYPTVDDSREKFTWGIIDPEILRDYAKKTFGWTELKTNEILMPVLKRQTDKKAQQSITNYFKLQRVTSTNELKVSKRVQKAIDKMSSGNCNSEDENIVTKKPRKTKKKIGIPMKKNDDSDDVEIIEGENDKQNTEKKTTKKEMISKKSETTQKTVRKRKIENSNESSVNPGMSSTTSQLISRINSESIALTSNSTIITKTARIPNGKQIIPQREKDVEEMQTNKLKAIELFKKSKTK